MPERAIQEMKNHLNSWREKFVHALFRHTCTLIACRNGEEKKQEVIGKNDFTLTKTVTILFVHERGNSVHASRGYAARSVPEFPRSWTNNIVTITSCQLECLKMQGIFEQTSQQNLHWLSMRFGVWARSSCVYISKQIHSSGVESSELSEQSFSVSNVRRYKHWKRGMGHRLRFKFETSICQKKPSDAIIFSDRKTHFLKAKTNT